MFEWLRKAPWGHPAFSGMFLSLIFFGFIGGISGVVLGTEQLNVLMHNTIYVPGHFHGTVVAGTTLAFMAATYIVLPLIFQREIVWPKLAGIQPYLFGIGAAGISLFLHEFIDAIAILAIVVLNAVLGVFQEYRASKAMAALKQMAAPVARVIRDGRTIELPTRELVRGDLVLLEAGNYVPADLRLIGGKACACTPVPAASAAGSLFARLYAGHTGVDPYTMAVSDTYQDLFGEGLCIPFHDGQQGPGKALGEARNVIRNDPVADARRHADDDFALIGGLPFIEGVHCGVSRMKNAASMLEKSASARSELNAAPVSRKEICLKFNFERAYLTAQRGLGYIQEVRGFSDAAEFSNLYEIP